MKLSLSFSLPSMNYNRRLSINAYWKPGDVHRSSLSQSLFLAYFLTSLWSLSLSIVKPVRVYAIEQRELGLERFEVWRNGEASLRNLIKNRRPDLFVLNNRVMCSRGKKSAHRVRRSREFCGELFVLELFTAAIRRVALNISEYPVVAIHARLTLAKLSPKKARRDKCLVFYLPVDSIDKILPFPVDLQWYQIRRFFFFFKLRYEFPQRLHLVIFLNTPRRLHISSFFSAAFSNDTTVIAARAWLQTSAEPAVTWRKHRTVSGRLRFE